MHKIDYIDYPRMLLTPEIGALLASVYEYKGKQILFSKANPDALSALLEIAKIQSTEASNRIEGIRTSDKRMRELMADKTTPRNRNEQEITGYRDVLNTIHGNYEFIPVSPSVILQLHRDLYSRLPTGIGGHWKMNDNIIEETDADGRSYVRFRPASAVETPDAMEALCSAYRKAIDVHQHDPLLLTAQFILDFLCIHPFHDGNGRMSRLLTLLLLYQSGFIVGKYISLEMLIEQSKESYYEALQASSVGWHGSTNDIKPFAAYMLGVILKAYRELERRISGLVTTKLSKGERIRSVILDSIGKISKRDILNKCPDISIGMVEATLKKLLDAGEIRKVGNGKSIAYVKS